jgi:hypothetical protein
MKNPSVRNPSNPKKESPALGTNPQVSTTVQPSTVAPKKLPAKGSQPIRHMVQALHHEAEEMLEKHAKHQAKQARNDQNLADLKGIHAKHQENMKKEVELPTRRIAKPSTVQDMLSRGKETLRRAVKPIDPKEDTEKTKNDWELKSRVAMRQVLIQRSRKLDTTVIGVFETFTAVAECFKKYGKGLTLEQAELLAQYVKEHASHIATVKPYPHPYAPKRRPGNTMDMTGGYDTNSLYDLMGDRIAKKQIFMPKIFEMCEFPSVGIKCDMTLRDAKVHFEITYNITDAKSQYYKIRLEKIPEAPPDSELTEEAFGRDDVRRAGPDTGYHYVFDSDSELPDEYDKPSLRRDNVGRAEPDPWMEFENDDSDSDSDRF